MSRERKTMSRLQFRAWDKRRQEYLTEGNIYIGLNGDKYLDVLDYRIKDDRFIIMQSTGLSDKNGKDLDWWEGDILEDEDGFKFVIEYSSQKMRFGLVCQSDLPIINHYFIGEDYQPCDLVKIGTIHTHKHLLGEKT